MTEDWSFDMKSIKRCPSCQLDKPLSEYWLRNKRTEIPYAYCRACAILKNSSYQENNKDKELNRKREYYQANKATLLQKKKEYYKSNKAKILEKREQYRNENYEIIFQAQRDYVEANRELTRFRARARKARKRANGIYQIGIQEELKLRAKPCFYCGSLEEIQLDHVVPVSRGGVHSIGNLVPACRPCNSSKNKWFITEWKKIKRDKANVR